MIAANNSVYIGAQRALETPFHAKNGEVKPPNAVQRYLSREFQTCHRELLFVAGSNPSCQGHRNGTIETRCKVGILIQERLERITGNFENSRFLEGGYAGAGFGLIHEGNLSKQVAIAEVAQHIAAIKLVEFDLDNTLFNPVKFGAGRMLMNNDLPGFVADQFTCFLDQIEVTFG